MRKCPICEKRNLVEADDIIFEIDSHFFVEKGSRCTNCGEEFFYEEETQIMIEKARRLGIWGNEKV